MKPSLLMYKRFLTMQMRRKLNVFAILTFVGVVLVTVSFVSPGWIVFKAETHYFDFSRDPDLHSEEVNLSAGLWYFSLCYHGSGSRGTYKDDRKVYIEPARRSECQMDTYKSNPKPYVAKTFLSRWHYFCLQVNCMIIIYLSLVHNPNKYLSNTIINEIYQSSIVIHKVLQFFRKCIRTFGPKGP